MARGSYNGKVALLGRQRLDRFFAPLRVHFLEALGIRFTALAFGLVVLIRLNDGKLDAMGRVQPVLRMI